VFYGLEANVGLIERRLFEKRSTIGPRYGVEEPAETPHEFANQLVNALEQPRVADPLRHGWTTREVFRAAVRSLGSNQTDWSQYMRSEAALQEVLLDFDPQGVADGLAAVPPTVRIEDIERVLHGQYRRSTATRIAAWAQRLTDEPDFYESIQQLGIAMKARAAISDDRELLPPLALAIAGFLTGYGQRDLAAAGAPARHPQRWKLPGMGFALTSEFLRTLGWDGFKPDTHIRRLFDRWLGEDQLERFAPRALELASVLGTHSKEAVDTIRYSLAGVAITPEGESASRIDNLIWLIGANVETARARPSTDTDYLRRR
jgi:hypothetical protein